MRRSRRVVPLSKTPPSFLSALLLSLLLLPARAPAQQTDIDWLLNRVARMKRDDTAKVNTLVMLARAVKGRDIGPAKLAGMEALRIAELLKYQKGIVASLVTLGHIGWSEGRKDTAALLYRRALTIAETIGYTPASRTGFQASGGPGGNRSPTRRISRN